MSSLQDVAKLAGVSNTLVSRTINNQSGVSEKNKKKILAAMEALHYEPNALARSLVKRRTGTIGIVMDTLCEPYFFPLIEGLESAIDTTGYDLVFSSARNSLAHKESAVKYYMQGRADGVIFYGSRLEDEGIIHSLAGGKFPFVVVENTFPMLDINNISLDNAFGSALAVDHLIACGCRKIFHVGGDMRHRVSIDRQNGFITAMQHHGVTVDSRMLIQADFDTESSTRIMAEYLRNTPVKELPDAFYCGSDNTAYGTVTALEEKGIRVPDDIMVIGFDNDAPPRGYRYRPLTTLSQPLKQMGVSAIETLIAKIEDPQAPCRHIVFYPELVRRQTTREKE